MRLSVMVPARNEEDVLEACLHSLLDQPGFLLERDWELIVIDDHSTDRTREIALGLRGALVLDAGPLPPSWTGKANALWTASRQSRGEWLLFTDADTVHQPGNLQRAIHEAERVQAALLSYSPRQLVSGFWQRALMPLIFAELARTYPPAKVSDPASPLAAANGQFLMVRRDAYFDVGGHSAVAHSLLEDVDLAALLKRRKFPILFRYAPDALSARMYRTTSQMLEGWTKNLARLFANPILLAARRALELSLLIALPLLVWAASSMRWAMQWAPYVLAALWAETLWRLYARAKRSNFPSADCALSLLGLPLFCFLLLRSWFDQKVRKQVAWKGRVYSIPKK